MKTRSQILHEIAEDQGCRCREWLTHFMRDGLPKPATKEELRDQAVRELGISKMSFDFAWIDAIETAARPDWYEPLPRLYKVET
jgi:hypothetical protein